MLTIEKIQSAKKEYNLNEDYINEDRDKLFSLENKSSLKRKIKGEMRIATSIIDSIKESFEERIGGLRKFKEFQEMVKSWEKQIRGACEQIIQKVDMSDFIIDKKRCSPLAYSKILKYDSRDLDVVQLSGAVIVFYNSLKE